MSTMVSSVGADTPSPFLSDWEPVCLLTIAEDRWQQDSRVSVLLADSAYRPESVSVNKAKQQGLH